MIIVKHWELTELGKQKKWSQSELTKALNASRVFIHNVKTDFMQTLTIELTGANSLKALKELEHNNLIRILNVPDLNSYALPGEAITEEDFKKWIEYAEDSATVSLTDARQRWAAQKKRLQKLIR